MSALLVRGGATVPLAESAALARDDEQAPDPLAGALLLCRPGHKSSVWAEDEDLRPRFAAGAHSISTVESGR